MWKELFFLRLPYFTVFEDYPLIGISYSELILAIVYSLRLLSAVIGAPIDFTGVRNPNVEGVLNGLSSKYYYLIFLIILSML